MVEMVQAMADSHVALGTPPYLAIQPQLNVEVLPLLTRQALDACRIGGPSDCGMVSNHAGELQVRVYIKVRKFGSIDDKVSFICGYIRVR